MMTTFKDKLKLGNGIYTTTDISRILQIAPAKINRWISKYWDGELSEAYETGYSWKVDNARAVGFLTVVEFYVIMQFTDAGVNIRQVVNAHKELSKAFKTPFPFAQKEVIESIHSDGKKIYLSKNGDIITLDGSRQFNLGFIELFFKKLDFDGEMLASKYWPLGKDHAIVCDPHHKFGQAVVEGTNIQAEAIYRMHLAGEAIAFIADIYEISEDQVLDALSFFDANVAA